MKDKKNHVIIDLAYGRVEVSSDKNSLDDCLKKAERVAKKMSILKPGEWVIQ